MTSTSGLKVLVYAIDIICTLLALVLISFGIYVLVSYDTNELASLGAYGYIGIGVAAIVLFLWGYLSAWRENICCTITFITLLYLVIAAQIATAFLLTRGKNSVGSNLANAMDDTWEEELNSPGAMSLYENWFVCCGRGSAQDYIVNERLPPETCFRDHDKTKPDNLIREGCRMKFEDYWLNLLNVFNSLAWALIVLELLLSFISCCLCNSIRNDRRRSYY